jgi:CubicO group peptidase (beta-lactamase class C family)
LALAGVSAAAQNRFTDGEAAGIEAFLRDTFRPTNSCMVIGLVDEGGSRVFSAGKLDNGTDAKADGDTVFFIGSVSKTFTALLLQVAVERGEMKLDEPVAKYLPRSVRMPARGGKEITLLHLATHSSGLPVNPDNMTGATEKEQYEGYTVEQMYAYLAGCTLSRDPGMEFGYSNVGMALLGHVLALRAGTNFESLVVNEICRPLQMGSTCIMLTPELKRRLAMGHDGSGKASPPWKLQVYAPAGSIHSTANDLLKYVAAEAGLTRSSLSGAMEKTHVIRFKDSRGLPEVTGFGIFGNTAMDWVDRGVYEPPGMELLGHAGGAGSYHAWAGFDKKQRRGVVVLTTENETVSVDAIGWTLLQRLPLTRAGARNFAREMVGLGFALDLDTATQAIRVTKVYADSPAARAGVSAGCLIQKINGRAVAGKSLGECLAMMGGPIGTKVQLEMVNAESKATNVVEVARGRFVTST